MTRDDANDFRTLMLGLGETYSKQIGTAQTSIYWNALIDYDIESIRGAVNAHMRDPDHGMFMPKPADLIRHIDGGSESQALNAWAKLIKAIREVGPYRSVVFDDWKIHAVVETLGGWQEICDWHTDKMHFHQRDFERLYKAMKPGRQFPPKLTGIIEHENEQRGYLNDIPEPLLIGEPEKAQQVLEHQTSEPQSVGDFAQQALEASG